MTTMGETGSLPSTASVVRAQVETVGLARRWTILILGGLTALVFAAELYAVFVRGVTDLNPLFLLGGPRGGPGAFVFVAFLAVFWALGVWHQETPSGRLYHWSMPVDRGAHDRLRVLAGALWLVAGIAAFLLGTIVMAVITGHGGSIGSVPATVWTTYVTGAVTLYLFAVVPAIRSEHPFGWVVGVFFTFHLLPPFMDAVLGFDDRLIHAWFDFMAGPVGPITALLGGMQRGPYGDPGWSAWLMPMLLWLGLGIAAVYVATLREPDA